MAFSTRTIELESHDGGTFTAYLAVPEQPNGGGVVVLQEIFGVNANIRGIVEDFAAAGYAAIAPDLFWRQESGVELNPGSEEDRAKAMSLLKGMDQPLAVADAMVAAETLRGLPGSNGKIGAVGYCLGGKLAYLMAMQDGIAAAASYYGVAIQAALGEIGDVKAKTILHLGETDDLCPPPAQAAIREAAAAHADHIEIMSYPGVGHAFARRASPPFNAEAAARADTATAALLRTQLLEG